MYETISEYMEHRPRLNISGQCVRTTYRPWEGAGLHPVYVPSELEIRMEELLRMQREIAAEFY